MNRQERMLFVILLSILNSSIGIVCDEMISVTSIYRDKYQCANLFVQILYKDINLKNQMQTCITEIQLTYFTASISREDVMTALIIMMQCRRKCQEQQTKQCE